jgi:hypothetical protein
MQTTPLEQLDNVTAIQCADGNWNYDPYMQGMANGLLLAQAIMKGEEPVYLSAPAQWLCDNPSSEVAPPQRPDAPTVTASAPAPGDNG